MAEPYRALTILVDLITADQKVLSASWESRNNHRYAIVVQDLATQWIHSYACKINTSQETQRSLQKFLEPDRKPKVIYYHSRPNQFERFRGFLDLFSRFEFEFRRRENYIFLNDSNSWCVQSSITHTMWSYMCMCCGLFVPTEFQFECCCARDS